MADIRIYGTLRNDTGEAAVYSSQVLDEGTGKTLDAIISDGIPAMQETEYTDAEIEAIAAAAMEKFKL